MAWGIQVTADIEVLRVLLRDVELKIEENNELINMFEKELCMYASSNPRDIVSDETRGDGEVVADIRIKIDNLLESYRECVRQNQLLEIVLENKDSAQDT
jgi:hypothetical protein